MNEMHETTLVDVKPISTEISTKSSIEYGHDYSITNEDSSINKNKPWRSVIRRIIFDGRSDYEGLSKAE